MGVAHNQSIKWVWLAVQSNNNNKPGFVGLGFRLVVVPVVGLGVVVAVEVGV